VYKEQVHDRAELVNRIIEAFALVTPEKINGAVRSLLRRARLCIECNGGHFEHLL